jgi:hypothetical protein
LHILLEFDLDSTYRLEIETYQCSVFEIEPCKIPLLGDLQEPVV